MRSAVYTLCSPNIGLSFVLLPMVHVGSREYFAEVEQRLRKCDVIMAEGLRSRRADYLTWSYRIAARIRRLNLVTQHVIDLRQFGAKVVNTDMAARTFDSMWGRVGSSARLVLLLVMPAYALYLFFSGTRALIGQHLAMDDLPSREDIFGAGKTFDAVNDVILTERDKVLIEHIKHFYELHNSRAESVAILYGARHMRAVLSLLRDKLGYRVTKAEWITVFDY